MRKRAMYRIRHDRPDVRAAKDGMWAQLQGGWRAHLPEEAAVGLEHVEHDWFRDMASQRRMAIGLWQHMARLRHAHPDPVALAGVYP